MGSASMDSTNHRSKTCRKKKSHIVADRYYGVQPMMVTSVLNMYFFSLSLFPKQFSITTIYTAFTLY